MFFSTDKISQICSVWGYDPYETRCAMTDQRNAQSSGLTFCEYVNRRAASTGYPPTDSPQVKSELLPDASKPVYGLRHGCCELLANIWKPEKMKTIQGSCLSHEPCIRLN